MKKKSFMHERCTRVVFVTLLSLVTFTFISCFSTPEPEPRVKVTIENVRKWLVGQEVTVSLANELTKDEVMEVTKIVISSGEIKGLKIVEESQKLSYAVMTKTFTYSSVPLMIKFNYSIAKGGKITLRILEVLETDEEKPFSFSMLEAKYDSYKANMIEWVRTNLLKWIGDTVVNRSADFS